MDLRPRLEHCLYWHPRKDVVPDDPSMPERLRHPAVMLAVGFAILATLLVGAFVLAEGQARDNGWVAHTLEVENRLAVVMSDLQSAETNQRGFVITGDAAYERAYERAPALLESDLHGLGTATADNPRQQAALMVVRPLIADRLVSLESGAKLRRNGGFAPAAAYVTGGRGWLLMNSVRTQIGNMRAEENRLLVQRQAVAARTRFILEGLLVFGFVGLVGLTVGAVRDANRRYDELRTAYSRLQAESDGRERAESQLRQMQKMEAIGHLTGGIAHDFNNMLSVVIGSLEMAKRRLLSAPDRAQVCIDNGLEAAQRAAGLTARLLAFSRQQPLAPTPLEPNRLVGDMSEMLRRTIGEHVQVETVLAGGVWRLNADAAQLESAILNLCVNARDAMPEGGRLTIETSNAFLDEAYAADHSEVAAGQYVLISVTDTGSGMTPEVMHRAFDPFYTTKEVGRGTGLGLSQVFGFVKQSGGHIKLYSEVGRGTSVKIYFPRWTGGLAMPADRVPTEPMPRAKDHEMLMVVEDDEKVRRVTADTLRELGYGVVQAGSGDEAIALLAEQTRVSLLVTDIVMPGMTGRVLADHVLAARPGLKIVFMTGYTRNAVVHNGILDSGVAFLQKPFTSEQLATKVRQVLDGGGANRP